jgi:hypothetical protein
MSARTTILAASIACLLGQVGCKVEIERDQDTLPLSFKVKIKEPTGEIDAPLPYSTAPRSYTIDIQAVDFHGEPADWFEGEVYLDVAPRGRLAKGAPRTVTLKRGKASGVAVAVERVHGESNLWVEDRGSDDKPGSYATGLSPTLHVEHPTLREISETEIVETSALSGDFVRVNATNRRLVVTGVAVDGFYLTDLDEPTAAFNAIFAHTHSRPEGVQQGDQIVDIIGTVVEFYGFTELGFPTYKVKGHVDDIPIQVLDVQTVGDNPRMEELESRLVQVRDVTVCALGDDYQSFGQWVVLLDSQGSCESGSDAITIVSALSATGFTPEAHVDGTLKSITGNLRYHGAANPPWIMYTRSDDDIEIE